MTAFFSFLLLSVAILLFFLSVTNIYKKTIFRIHESSTLLNLIFLSARTLYKWELTTSRTTLLEMSIGIAFAQFWVIVLWNLIKPCFSAGWKCKQNQTNDVINQEIYDDITHE